MRRAVIFILAWAARMHAFRWSPPRPAPAPTTSLAAKKRDYASGGLGSSKQEQFAALWRSRDNPDAAEEKAPPTDLSEWEADVARAEAADELVPDANWRLRAGSATKTAAATVAPGRAVAVAAWAPLEDASGASYTAAEAWAAADAQGAPALVLVVGRDSKTLDAAARALYDRLPKSAAHAVVVQGGASGAKKRQKGLGGSKLTSLQDPSQTFAAACGVDAGATRVLVLAPPHPSPDAHTIVSRFPARPDTVAGLADAIVSALREKQILVHKGRRRTGL